MRAALARACVFFAGAALVPLGVAPARGAFLERPLSARLAALGETGVAAADEPGALGYNPAMGGMNRHWSWLSTYGLYYETDDLSAGHTSLQSPAGRWGGWGISYNQFGPPFYKEQEFAAAHGFHVGRAVFAGYGVKYQELVLDRYGSHAAWSVDGGLLAAFGPWARVGAAVRNFNQPSLGSWPEGPAPELRGGAFLSPSPHFNTALEAVRRPGEKFSWRAGQEFGLSLLFLRFGVETQPNRYTWGLGLLWKSLRWDYALVSHPFLGDQHHMSLALSWGAAEDASTPSLKEARPTALEKINLNTAGAEALESLPGIGPAMAEKIVRQREAVGQFSGPEDLFKIPRFSRRLWLKVEPHVTFGEGPAPAAGVPGNHAP